MKRIADLSVFVSVVKAGSLSEASNDLGLSVASISKYISVSYTHLTLPTTPYV